MAVSKKTGVKSTKQVSKDAKAVIISKKQESSSQYKIQKIYVIDTSVLLHDHNCIHSFEDNRIAIPITVLEELDKFKVGNEIKNFEARECIRIIDYRKNIRFKIGFPSIMEWAAHCELF